MSDHVLTDVLFESLDLEPSLLEGVKHAGFDHCTPIQAQALPLALAGQDVQGQAQTGTGKTAAFLLATMNYLLRRPPNPKVPLGHPRALILAPTRELVVQIAADAHVLGDTTPLRTGAVYGGTGYDEQRIMLEDGLDILVGTPGRLIDYFKQGIYSLDGIQVVVLDEADRMFDLGFIKDVRYLLRRMPPSPQRLNMIFSATLSLRVTELAYEHLNAPSTVDANPPDQVTVERVTQKIYHVAREDKIPLLLGLLGTMDATRTMLFVNTKRDAELVARYLTGNGIGTALLTGDVPQKKRLSLLERFKSGDVPVLVATDVAARGLHIPGVSHVINYDLPQDAEDYVHRVGRTARAGESGDAISFGCERYVYSLPEIEAFIGSKIPVEAIDRDMLVVPKPPSERMFTRRPGPGGPGGGRNRDGRRRHGSSSSQGRGSRRPSGAETV